MCVRVTCACVLEGCRQRHPAEPRCVPTAQTDELSGSDRTPQGRGAHSSGGPGEHRGEGWRGRPGPRVWQCPSRSPGGRAAEAPVPLHEPRKAPQPQREASCAWACGQQRGRPAMPRRSGWASLPDSGPQGAHVERPRPVIHAQPGTGREAGREQVGRARGWGTSAPGHWKERQRLQSEVGRGRARGQVAAGTGGWGTVSG